MEIEEAKFDEYREWLAEIKQSIKSSRVKVALTINKQLIELYWYLGKEISVKSKKSNWGAKVIDQMSIDLRHEFPELKGFSRRNLYAMKQWYEFYSVEFEFMPQAVAQLPWGHNRTIVSKIKTVAEALGYAKACIKEGWTRESLMNQIESNYYQRVSHSSNNFSKTLSNEHSKIVSQIVKDPYNFDFINLHDEALEREVENQLVTHITKFLLELGKGFAYVGNQYKIEVSENDYYIDLLFYHLELRCYVVIELKSGGFKPEYAGKLNFYLSAVDSQLKQNHDNPSIGLILCKRKDKIEAEYALRDLNKPIGISEYKLQEAIPAKFKTQLPSIQELEADLESKMNKNA